MAYPLSSLVVQQVTLSHKYLGQDVVNVLHFAKTPNDGGAFPDGPPSSAAFLTTFRDIWIAQIIANVSDALTFTRIRIDQVVGWDFGSPPLLAPKPRLADTDQLDVGAVGLIAGAQLPSYVAVTGRKNTALAGRKWRGSARIAGIPEIATEGAQGNLLTAPALAAFQASWNQCCASFRPDVFGAPLSFMRQCVFSLRRLAEATIIPGNYATWQYAQLITQSKVNEYVGSQVSRKVGHGA